MILGSRPTDVNQMCRGAAWSESGIDAITSSMADEINEEGIESCRRSLSPNTQCFCPDSVNSGRSGSGIGRSEDVLMRSVRSREIRAESKGGSRKKTSVQLRLSHHSCYGVDPFPALFVNLRAAVRILLILFFLFLSLVSVDNLATTQNVVHAQRRSAAATPRAWPARRP